MHPGNPTILADRYQLTRLLGEGGMGQVFLASDLEFSRNVAIKVLHAHACRDSTSVKRFSREADVLKSIRHTGLVRLLDWDLHGDRQFLVFEFVEGQSLSNEIAAGRVEPGRALQLAGEIAEAVGVLHEHGIVHRDLKPANVMVRANGEACVLDLGIARRTGDGSSDDERVTSTGCIVGTVLYMPPEAWLPAARPHPTQDVWAIGVMLHEMLTGAPPFPDPDDLGLAAFVGRIKEPPRPASRTAPGLSTRIDRLIASMMEVDVDRRLADATAAARAIAGVQASLADEVEAPARAGAGRRSPGDLPRRASSHTVCSGKASVPARPAIRPPGSRARTTGRTTLVRSGPGPAGDRWPETARVVAIGTIMTLAVAAGLAASAPVLARRPPSFASPAPGPSLHSSPDGRPDADRIAARLLASLRRERARIGQAGAADLAGKLRPHRQSAPPDAARLERELTLSIDRALGRPLVEEFVGLAHAYFDDPTRPERDDLARMLADVEHLEAFADYHGLEFPGWARGARLRGPWAEIVHPRRDLVDRMETVFVQLGAGVADGRSWTRKRQVRLPSGLADGPALVWIGVARWQPGYVFELVVNGHKMLLADVTDRDDPVMAGMRVHLVDGTGQPGPKASHDLLVDGQKPLGFVGRWLPPGVLRPGRNAFDLTPVRIAAALGAEEPRPLDLLVSFASSAAPGGAGRPPLAQAR